jgi:hypothetical protein
VFSKATICYAPGSLLFVLDEAVLEFRKGWSCWVLLTKFELNEYALESKFTEGVYWKDLIQQMPQISAKS